MSNIMKLFLTVGVLIALIYVFVEDNLNTSGGLIYYDEFKRLLKNGKVKEVVIGDTTVRGYLYPDNLYGLIRDNIAEDYQNGKLEPQFTTPKVDDFYLIETLEESKIPFRGEMSGGMMNFFITWVLPLMLMLGFFIMTRMYGNQASSMMAVGKSKAKVLMQKDVGITFADVAGIDEGKEELQEIVSFLKDPQKFQYLGGKMPKGVLLVGPPGTGKTLLAKAMAGESGVPFFLMSGSEFVEMFVGVGAARVRDLFAQSQKFAPCIIFIDELDALGKVRGVGPASGGHDEREQTLNQLLVEMDGFDSSSGVIIVAATNRPETLDPALLRPGRFDRHILVDRPDIEGREAIIRVHIKNVKLADDVDIRKIAARTPGFVGADLANMVNEAALLAARKKLASVTMFEFEEAIDRVVAGLEKKSRRLNEKEKRIVAFHESGHAVVAHFSMLAEPVHKISIIPRGIAGLGFTQQLPTEDRFLMSKDELTTKISVLLGGRIAEELVFGDISTGAQNDLARATDIAERMVRDYGMSSLGPVTYDLNSGPNYLGSYYGRRDISPTTAEKIDAEINRIIQNSYTCAREILSNKRHVLEKISEILLKKEVLDSDEFLKIIKEAGEDIDE